MPAGGKSITEMKENARKAVQEEQKSDVGKYIKDFNDTCLIKGDDLAFDKLLASFVKNPDELVDVKQTNQSILPGFSFSNGNNNYLLTENSGSVGIFKGCEILASDTPIGEALHEICKQLTRKMSELDSKNCSSAVALVFPDNAGTSRIFVAYTGDCRISVVYSNKSEIVTQRVAKQSLQKANDGKGGEEHSFQNDYKLACIQIARDIMSRFDTIDLIVSSNGLDSLHETTIEKIYQSELFKDKKTNKAELLRKMAYRFDCTLSDCKQKNTGDTTPVFPDSTFVGILDLKQFESGYCMAVSERGGKQNLGGELAKIFYEASNQMLHNLTFQNILSYAEMNGYYLPANGFDSSDFNLFWENNGPKNDTIEGKPVDGMETIVVPAPENYGIPPSVLAGRQKQSMEPEEEVSVLKDKKKRASKALGKASDRASKALGKVKQAKHAFKRLPGPSSLGHRIRSTPKETQSLLRPEDALHRDYDSLVPSSDLTKQQRARLNDSLPLEKYNKRPHAKEIVLVLDQESLKHFMNSLDLLVNILQYAQLKNC